VQRRHLLGTVAGGAMSGLAGCGVLSPDCPDDPIVDGSIPPARRSLEFLSDENRPEGVKAAGPPTIQFDEDTSQVIVRGVFNGASPKSQFPKNMIVVNRLAYDEQEDTLHVRLVKRQCKSRGAAVAEVTPYELRVKFPDDPPADVCAQEGPDGLFGKPDGTYSTCVSR
jgi:hypothetical protein